MRDTIMTEQYFNDFIAEETARIQRFSTKLASGEIRADRIYSVERRVHSLKFGVFIANYSLGTELEKLKKDFEEILKDFPHFWTQTSSYINMVWVMSIAIMLEVDKDNFFALTALLGKYNRHDALLDFFSSYKLYGTVSLDNRKFTCPVPYAALGEIIDNDCDRLNLIKTYLEKKWYAGHKQFGICDTHKSREKIYSGYWSFESGALVKIFGIDDKELKNSRYYPYDLVHFS